MKECIIGEGLCAMEVYRGFLGVNPEVAVLICRSVGGLRKWDKEKTYSRANTAVARHDLGFGQGFRIHCICHRAAVAVPIIDFQSVFGLFRLGRRQWWPIWRLKICAIEAFEFKRFQVNILECAGLEIIRLCLFTSRL